MILVEIFFGFKSIVLCSAGCYESIEILLEHGAEIDKTDVKSQTPLFIAMVNQHWKCGTLLLEKGADPNIADEEGLTPLHTASHPRHIGHGDLSCYKDIAQMLLDHRADLNAVCNSGHTPLSFALMRGKTEIANIIQEHGVMEL